MLARPSLPSFDYVRASTFDEVVLHLNEHGGAARLLMGGTDLLVRMRDGAIHPKVVIDVKYVPGMRTIGYDGHAGLSVGAAATMNQVARHPDVQAHYPVLAEAADAVASYQLRNRATIGGNLCNASPCADTAPAALVYGASVVLYGSEGERTMPAQDFFVGPGQAALRAGEFMTGLRFPVPPAGSVGRYLKLGRNKLGDLALVSVAVLGFPDSTAPSGCRFRIALGSVAPTPLRVPDAEDVLADREPDEERLALAAQEATRAAAPISDVRASAEYRSAMVRNLTLRALRVVWARLSAARHSVDHP